MSIRSRLILQLHRGVAEHRQLFRHDFDFGLNFRGALPAEPLFGLIHEVAFNFFRIRFQHRELNLTFFCVRISRILIEMKDFAIRAINTASTLGARYADVRIIISRNQSIAVKNGKVEGLGDFESIGFGVRVLVGDAWGFASSAEITAPEVDRVTALAVETARPAPWFPENRWTWARR